MDSGSSGRDGLGARGNRRRLVLAVGVVSFSLFTILYYRNAWVVDDAYITFRSIDNLLNGYGLRWNVGERVQSYTHPLWMLLHIPFFALTGEYFYTGILVSYLVCIATLLLVWSQLVTRAAAWRAPLFMLLLVSCKAVFDYTSSGLENPLSYLLCAGFFIRLLLRPSNAGFDRREMAIYFFIASLAYVNRPDLLLVFIPVLVYCFVQGMRETPRATVATILLATSPAWLWTGFSLFYYGFPFPNTYYAKSANSGIPLDERLRFGAAYFEYSLRADLPSAVALLLGGGFVARERHLPSALTLAGIVLYLIYVFLMGATATHMAHRFLAVPVFVSLILIVTSMTDTRFAWGTAAAALAALLLLGNSPLRTGTPWYRMVPSPAARIDTKSFVHITGGSLLGNLPPGDVVPTHAWYRDGLAFRRGSDFVRYGGPGRIGHPGMGYFGFAAGPGKHIVDPVALSDPLLARLPGRIWWKNWKPGHYRRKVPRGYMNSVETGENRVVDPTLARYYEKIRSITRGPLFDTERLRAIVAINLGAYDDWIDDYVARHPDPHRIGRKPAPQSRDRVEP